MASISRQAGTVTGEPHFASDLRPGPGTQIEYYTREDGQGNLEAQFQYGFDPLGRRISKVNEVTGEGEWFTYRDDDVAADFAREGGGPFTLTATYVQDLGIDARVIKIDADGIQHNFLLDVLSSVGATTDAAAAAVETNLMGAWGETLAASSLPDPRTSGLAQRERDLESSLQYNRQRLLDTRQGRFVQRDSVFVTRVREAFEYGSNDPLRYWDPTGEQSRFTEEERLEQDRLIAEALVIEFPEAELAATSTARTDRQGRIQTFLVEQRGYNRTQVMGRWASGSQTVLNHALFGGLPDRELLGLTLLGEGRGESDDYNLWVGAVIVNRSNRPPGAGVTQSDRFGVRG